MVRTKDENNKIFVKANISKKYDENGNKIFISECADEEFKKINFKIEDEKKIEIHILFEEFIKNDTFYGNQSILEKLKNLFNNKYFDVLIYFEKV